MSWHCSSDSAHTRVGKTRDRERSRWGDPHCDISTPVEATHHPSSECPANGRTSNNRSGRCDGCPLALPFRRSGRPCDCGGSPSGSTAERRRHSYEPASPTRWIRSQARADPASDNVSAGRVASNAGVRHLPSSTQRSRDVRRVLARGVPRRVAAAGRTKRTTRRGLTAHLAGLIRVVCHGRLYLLDRCCARVYWMVSIVSTRSTGSSDPWNKCRPSWGMHR